MGSRLCKPSVMLIGAAGWPPRSFFPPPPPPSQRLTKEHLLKDKIEKPMAVYFEDRVFAFTSC